jgi:molybdenum cofactor biosynthesis enzyme MoaA
LENQEHREVWEMFSYIIPKNYRVDFIEYVVSNNPDSDTYAHVQQNSEDYTKWELHINRSAFYDTKGNLIKKESLHTLIHEFAHVLTLNKSQVQYYPLDAPEYTL